jgi:peptidoglycan/LPS O-acetylase OafA/YrhL
MTMRAAFVGASFRSSGRPASQRERARRPYAIALRYRRLCGVIRCDRDARRTLPDLRLADSLRLDRHRLPLLDAVRGFCTLCVVVYHYKGPLLARLPWPALERLFGTFWTCLDCFFVLSGLLLGGILLEHRGASSLAPTFYARRALRIVPVYLIAVAFNHCINPDDGLLKYLTFTQNVVWSEQQNWTNPSMAVTWSLAVEEHFYIIVPVLIWLVPVKRLPWVLVSLIASALALRSYLSLVVDNQLAASILMPCRMDGLFLGVLLAWLLRQDRFLALVAANRGALRACVVVLGAAFATYALTADPLGPFVKTVGLSFNGLFYTVFLLWLLIDHGGRRLTFPVRVLSWVGLGAFSIYLSHIAVMSAVRAQFGATGTAAVISAAIIATLAFASWHLIEKPCIQLGKRIRYSRPASAPMMTQAEAR